jgi:hypothetical protein
LKKLQIFKEGFAESDDQLEKLSVKYDLFVPVNNFRKSAPPPPKYKVIILR